MSMNKFHSPNTREAEELGLIRILEFSSDYVSETLAKLWSDVLISLFTFTSVSVQAA